jgi:hypothetical protein
MRHSTGHGDGSSRLDRNNVGHGRPIVLLHTLPTQLDYFDLLLRQLDVERAELIAVDLPGHGESSAPSVDYTASYFTDAVAALLDACEQRKSCAAYSRAVSTNQLRLCSYTATTAGRNRRSATSTRSRSGGGSCERGSICAIPTAGARCRRSSKETAWKRPGESRRNTARRSRHESMWRPRLAMPLQLPDEAG